MSNRREFLKNAALAVGAVHASTVGVIPDTQRQELLREARCGRKKPVFAKNGMVICTHPLAAQAGVEILKAGGNACDAACTVAAAQTVLEPHHTTITGCFCLLYYDAHSRKVSYVNGDINSPLAGLPHFSSADTLNGRGIGVPGWWGGFEAALSKLGTKSRAEIMKPAIEYAREGFPIYALLYGEMFSASTRLGVTPEGREIFMPQGALLSPGEVLKQEKAADTLERLASDGSEYFYHGEFAREYCEVIHKHQGVITPDDFARYTVRWDQVARSTYRGYEVVASPPPDNGGTHIIEALNMIELIDVHKYGPPSESVNTMRELILISNEVMSAGARQTDPRSHPVPLDVITSKEYAAIRYKLLQMSGPVAQAPSPAGTTHITVVDREGNVASALHSCMSDSWQNGLFVAGVSICASGVHFLRVMPNPGDRASVFLAPNIIFKNGKPILASGSPSASLVMAILQNIVNILDFDMTMEDSVHRPRFGAVRANGANMIEADIADEMQRGIVELGGVTVERVSPWHFLNGSFEGIYISPVTGMLSACGDPRRTAQAVGY